MERYVTRRSMLKATGAASTTALAGCTSGSGGGSGGPIKIGAVLPMSGGLSVIGQENKRGMKVAEEVLGGKVLGKDLEVVYADSQTKTSSAVQKTKEMVEKENVDALAGIASSANGLAVIPYLQNEAQLPQAFTHVGTNAAREKEKYCNRYSFYPWASFRQQAIPHVEFIQNELGKLAGDIDTSKVYFLGLDYEAGQSAREMVKEYMERSGGELEGATMVPLGTKDLAPYLSEAENADADIISGFMPGGNGVRFIKQAAEFGLPEKKVMCPLGDATSPMVLAAAGKAAKGWFGAHWYDEDRDAEMNNQFKEIYRSNWKKLPPNDIAASGFNALFSVAQGMEKAGSRKPDDVIEAMGGMAFDSPMGQLTYRVEDHQAKLNNIGYEVVDGSDDSGWQWDRKVYARYPDVVGEVMCTV